MFQFTRPRGARPRPAEPQVDFAGFNSRAHGGRDRRPSTTQRPSLFQFTRPRGARRKYQSPVSGTDAFQFTRPRGARQFGDGAFLRVGVSIHAPTGGATQTHIIK